MKKYAMLPITRADYGQNESRNLPDWLEDFADNYEKSAEQKDNLTEKIKERYSQLSFQDKINQILNGGSKTSPYCSVDEAVEDYQRRTGFAEYRKMIAAQKILEAGKESKAQEDPSEKKTLISDKSDEIPVIVQQVPAIDQFIRNKIETNYGIQLPAIQHAILENFRRQGVSPADVRSPLMAQYINNILIENGENINQVNDPDLGRGVGLNDESTGDFRDSNKNPFAGLTPSLTYR